MFEYISGKLQELSPTSAVVECGGVGYFLNISLNTYTALQGKENAKLYIYEAIREDAITLFGFGEKKEREMFLQLIGVSGVGANTARMILSSFSPDDLAEAIIGGNIAMLKSVKGIGLKTAERIIVDLKDKIKRGGFSSSMGEVASSAPSGEEAIAALMALGFNRVQSQKAVASVLKANPSAEVGLVVKNALKLL